MPIDGTYGRLNAHKERMKDMRSKRRDKKENTSRSSRFSQPEIIKNNPIDHKKLEKFEERFNRALKIKKKRDNIFSIALIIGAILVSYLMIKWALGL